MENYKIQLIETFFVLIGYIVIHFITKTYVNNTLKNTHLQRGRRKMIIKAAQLLLLTTALIFMCAIWGLNQNEIAVFMGTMFTALGIAFFAQWSLLSNITSSLLLFFNHPIRIGHTIKILDKDYPFEGEVTDLTYFFVHLKNESGEIVIIPNSILLQKSILIIDNNIN